MRVAIPLFFAISLARGADFQFEGRFHFSPIESNAISQGVKYQNRIYRNLGYSAAARAAMVTWEIDRLEYSGDVHFNLVAWARLNLRMNQQTLLSIGSGSTDLMTSIRLEGFPFPFFGLFVETGWFERWIALNSSTFVPAFDQASIRDRDFAARFGVHLRPIQTLLLTFTAGTIEEILVFNFNNPFVEIRTTYSSRIGDLFAFGRYKLLLGFGRLDEFAAGIGIRLNSPANSWQL